MTSSSSTYIIILCAYYFERQASHRQVKASAQSSPSNQLGQQQCIPELSELEASLGVLTPVARDPTVRTRPWQAQQPHWLCLSTWYRSRTGSTRVVTVGATHRLCDRLPPNQVLKSAPVQGHRTGVHPLLGYRTFRGDGREGAKRLTWLRSKMARMSNIVRCTGRASC